MNLPEDYNATRQQVAEELRKSLGELLKKEEEDERYLLYRLFQLKMLLELEKALDSRMYNIEQIIQDMKLK